MFDVSIFLAKTICDKLHVTSNNILFWVMSGFILSDNQDKILTSTNQKLVSPTRESLGIVC